MPEQRTLDIHKLNEGATAFNAAARLTGWSPLAEDVSRILRSGDINDADRELSTLYGAAQRLMELGAELAQAAAYFTDKRKGEWPEDGEAYYDIHHRRATLMALADKIDSAEW
jgi:hypothetical protein